MSIQDFCEFVTATPSVMQLVLCTFITFVVVYRWDILSWIKFNHPKMKRFKVLKCETCFAFWFCLLISTNLITAMIGYLIFNFYEKD